MDGELLSIIEYIERERGIEKEVLISAIEAALASAAHKILGNKDAEVTVKLDKDTGNF